MKNLMTLTYSTEFKLTENVFIFKVSAAFCLYLGKKVIADLVKNLCIGIQLHL